MSAHQPTEQEYAPVLSSLYTKYTLPRTEAASTERKCLWWNIQCIQKGQEGISVKGTTDFPILFNEAGLMTELILYGYTLYQTSKALKENSKNPLPIYWQSNIKEHGSWVQFHLGKFRKNFLLNWC